MRKVVCKICGNKIDKDKAYCVETISKKTGKINRKYYCDDIEYDNFINQKQKEKEDKENMFNLFNEILGYECVAFTLINKEIKPILTKYTYEDINYCLNELKEQIRDYMELKDIDKEYQRIRYIITVLESNIMDKTNEHKKLIENIEHSKKTITVEEIKEEDIPFSDVNFKSKDTIDFTQLF